MTQGYTPDGYILTMTYDAENRLTIAEYTDSGSILHRTEYSYSGNSLLAEVKKYENGALVSDTRFIRAGFLPVQERDSGNNVTREYTWGLNYGGGIGGLLNLNQGGQDYSYLYDGKGNVTALIDNSQNVVASYRYDAFGVLKTKTGTIEQPFMFSTKRYDEKTGLSYYGYRYYSPSIGRWITRDPIGEEGGINLYEFVKNNPISLIDKYGLIVEKCQRKAEILWGLVNHYWLRTDSKEAGMGRAGGNVPGEQYDFLYITETEIVDHTGEGDKPGSTCKELQCISEECVNKELIIGKPTGRFSLWNNCKTLVNKIIKKCQAKGAPGS